MMADAYTGISSLDVFKAKMSLLFDVNKETWINELYNVATTKINEGLSYQDPLFYDVLLQDENAPQQFKQRFKVLTNLRERRAKGEDVPIPSIAEYVATEKSYNKVLKDYGMQDLATTENYTKLVENLVDPQTLSDRLNIAYDAVKKSDAALREQFGNVSDAELAKALVLGDEGVKELQTRVNLAGIKAEMATRNMQTYVTAQELEAKGFTRADVAKGLTSIQEQLPSAQRLESLYGGMTPQETQKSLEQEVFQGASSQRRQRLAEQEQAAFSGASGIQRSSLSRRKPGLI